MIPVFLFNFLVPSEAALASPAPVPLFVKLGFSSVLEFEAKPARVVIGDAGSFQVERLDHSLVVRPTVDEATTNLIVYFHNEPARMFVLRSTQEEEPALYRKYGAEKRLERSPPIRVEASKAKATQIVSAKFDTKKDFLTVDAELSAPSSGKLEPDWNSVRLKAGMREIAPKKLWAQRTEIQADSSIRTRFVFYRPDVGRSLKGASLVLPLKGQTKPLILQLRGPR